MECPVCKSKMKLIVSIPIDNSTVSGLYTAYYTCDKCGYVKVVHEFWGYTTTTCSSWDTTTSGGLWRL